MQAQVPDQDTPPQSRQSGASQPLPHEKAKEIAYIVSWTILGALLGSLFAYAGEPWTGPDELIALLGCGVLFKALYLGLRKGLEPALFDLRSKWLELVLISIL